MKILKTLKKAAKVATLIGTSVSMAVPSSINAATFFTAITDDLTQPEAKKVFQLLQNTSLESRESDCFVYLDSSGNEFDRFDAPSMRNKKGRQKHLIPHWNTLFQYLKDGIQSEEDAFGAVDIVSVIDFMTTQDCEGDVSLLVIGNISIDDEEREFSFVDRSKATIEERYLRPTHGHVFAKRSQSLFSAEGREDALKGLRILWYNPFEDLSGHKLHRKETANFLSLWISEMGGELVTVTSSPSKIKNTLFSEDARTLTPRLHRDETILKMVHTPRLRNREPIEVEIPGIVEEEIVVAVIPEPIEVPEIPEPQIVVVDIPQPRPQVVHPPIVEPEPSPEDQEIIKKFDEKAADSSAALGILWNKNIDLDLYLIDPAEGKPIYFSNKKNDYAEYQNDIQNGSALWEQTLLSRVPPNLKAYVNFYSGKTLTKVSGKYMIRVNGQTTTRSFELKARKGNKADDFGNRNTSSYWTELNISELYGRGE